jgi:hypothetical protein
MAHEPDGPPGHPTEDEPAIEGLAAALQAAFPGVAVVDHGLELGPGAGVVELAAVDGDGRLMLVTRAPADVSQAALLSLDALAFARAHLPLLERHYRGAGLDAEQPPLLVLLAERFDPALLARLAAIDPALLACLEIRRIASRERAESYLMPVALGPGAGSQPAPARPADFLEHLHPDLRPIGEALLQRLARIDEDLSSSSSGRQMRFALDGEPVCTLQALDGALEARVAPLGGAFRVASRADADAFLEAVLERTLELFQPNERKGPVLAPADGSGGPGGLGQARRAALDPLLPSGAILTPEELEAFRSPS